MIGSTPATSTVRAVPAAARAATDAERVEQIDLVKAMCARYPGDLAMAYTAADIERAHKAHRIASLTGVEGGHQIRLRVARPPSAATVAALDGAASSPPH
jgi:microsomal dipeptidase-like Zn-dependent dipeptidase